MLWSKNLLAMYSSKKKLTSDGKKHLEGFFRPFQETLLASPNLVAGYSHTRLTNTFSNENPKIEDWKTNLFSDFKNLATTLNGLFVHQQTTPPKDVAHLITLLKSYSEGNCRQGMIYNHPCILDSREMKQLILAVRMCLEKYTYKSLVDNYLDPTMKAAFGLWKENYHKLPNPCTYRSSGWFLEEKRVVDIWFFMAACYSHPDKTTYDFERTSQVLYCLFPDYVGMYLDHNPLVELRSYLYRDIFKDLVGKQETEWIIEI